MNDFRAEPGTVYGTRWGTAWIRGALGVAVSLMTVLSAASPMNPSPTPTTKLQVATLGLLLVSGSRL